MPKRRINGDGLSGIMTRKCFFLPNLSDGEECVSLPRETVHHLESVLRSRPGDSIELRDGEGHAWEGVIEEIKGGAIRVRLLERRILHNESPLKVTLAVAIARSDRMELVIRQATELGVNRIVVFRAARSQYGLRGAQAEKKHERWLKIAREALCQCGRARIPEIMVLSEIEELLAYVPGWEKEEGLRIKVVALESKAEKNLLALTHSVPVCKQVMTVIGPEGGWSDQEVERFRKADFDFVHLGPRILRFETAAVAIVSAVQLLWGDFGGSIGEQLK